MSTGTASGDPMTAKLSISRFHYASPKDIIAAGSILASLSLIVVGLRFYARQAQKASISIDDWLTIPVAALNIGAGALLVIGAKKGALGYAIPYPVTEDFEMFLVATFPQSTLAQKIFFWGLIIQTLALGLIKLSTLHFYRRIFDTGKPSIFRFSNQTMMALTVAWTIAFFVVLIFGCGTDFTARWTNAMDYLDNCIDLYALYDGLAISDFLFDLAILVLPIPKIWCLQMTLARRIAIMGVFMTAILAVAASIMRMVVFIKAGHSKFGEDVDMEASDAMYFSMIESALALTAACLPTIHVLFRKFSVNQLIRSLRSLVTSRSPGSGLSSNPQHIRLEEHHVGFGQSNAHLANVRGVKGTVGWIEDDVER